MIKENINPKFFDSTVSLSSYLSIVRKYPVPTSEEEEALFNNYQKNHSIEARNEIVMRNQRFVFANAKIYAKTSDEILDYVSEGNIGLMEAIESFNPDRGFKFITYAVWYVKRAMNQYYMGTKNMIIRSNSPKFSSKIRKIKEKFFNENGREMTNEEVATKLQEEYDLEVKNMSDVFDVSITSIDENPPDFDTNDGDMEYNMKTYVDNEFEEDVTSEYNKEIIRKILQCIPDENYREELKMYFGIDYDPSYTIEMLATEFHRPEAQIYAEISNMIAGIRQYFKQKELIY